MFVWPSFHVFVSILIVICFLSILIHAHPANVKRTLVKADASMIHMYDMLLGRPQVHGHTDIDILPSFGAWPHIHINIPTLYSALLERDNWSNRVSMLLWCVILQTYFTTLETHHVSAVQGKRPSVDDSVCCILCGTPRVSRKSYVGMPPGILGFIELQSKNAPSQMKLPYSNA
jgi:hypothetical protein